jgi:hypothetical protein
VGDGLARKREQISSCEGGFYNLFLSLLMFKVEHILFYFLILLLYVLLVLVILLVVVLLVVVVVLFIIERDSCKSIREHLLAQVIAETAKAHVSNANGL